MKPKPTWIDPFLVRLRKGDTPIKRLQGSHHSPVLVLAPVPTQKEVDDNLAWSSPYAEVFFEMMSAVSPHGPNDFLIMPSIFGLPKRKKVSAQEAELSTAIFKAAGATLTIRGFVCIGSEPFKLFVGNGRCPSMVTLSGSVLRAPQTGNKPMVIVPDLQPMFFQPEGMSRREVMMAQQQQRAIVHLLEKTNVFGKINQLFK